VEDLERLLDEIGNDIRGNPPDISVANIDNNMRIRADLVAPLDRSATEAWLRRL
jgi:hypothetical protein